MKGVLRTGVGRGEASEEGGERRKGRLEILQIWDFGVENGSWNKVLRHSVMQSR